MEENIKVRWLTDHEQTKIAPKTLITQVLNENGSRFKDSFDTAIAEMTESVEAGNRQIRDHANNTEVHVTPEEKEAWNSIEVPSLDGYVTEDYVERRFQTLNSNTKLGFYCIEDVTIIKNDIPTVYPANSNVEISFVEGDVWEIVPTSNNSILSLTAFPSALGTYYPWLEGVRQFSNILFDMNNVDFYSKWSQGNQGLYQVQFAQYSNCIFWSDNAYVKDVTKRTNYTLYYTAQLPLCYSRIPDNTFKTFFLALGVNSDPNWGNPLYRESFAKANWATQAFSYYGARTVGLPSLDADEFNIVLPKDCRGLMFDARYIENAGVFDATNTTNFGAKSGSWRDAFGYCISLKSLQIKNLKVNLNISWSPIDYISIKYIIDNAANTNAITIYVSPYTYNLLSQADFDLAASKNITVALLSTNYMEDKRLGEIAGKADKTYVDTKIADLVNSAPEALDTLGELATAFGENQEVVDILNASITNKQNKNVIVYKDSNTGKASMTAPEVMEKVRAGENVYYTTSLSSGTLHPYLEGSDTGVFFYSNYIDNDRVIGTGILVSADGTITNEAYQLEHLTDTIIHITAAERDKWNNTYSKTETDSLLETKANIENPAFEGSMSLTGEAWFAGDVYTGSTSGTNKDEGSKKLATEEYVNTAISNIEIPEANEDVLLKTEQVLTDEELAQVKANLRYIGKNTGGLTVTPYVIEELDFGTENHRIEETPSEPVIAGEGAEVFNLYDGMNVASGAYSVSQGSHTVATGAYSVAQGHWTMATGMASKASGLLAKATGNYSTAEGTRTVASKNNTHAEGDVTQATGTSAHSEGNETVASGNVSHAEGWKTKATGVASHAEGEGTIAAGRGQTAMGRWNVSDTSSKLIVGIGTKDTDRKNGFRVSSTGQGYFASDVYANNDKKLATEEFVTQKVAEINVEAPTEYDAIVLKSSTEGSSKKFRLTIDDNGVLSAEEVVL